MSEILRTLGNIWNEAKKVRLLVSAQFNILY